MKIQQMAFVLVAFMIFFGFVALFYLSVKTRSLSDDAGELQYEKARAEVRKLAAAPELAWTIDDCSSCIDLDKAIALKDTNLHLSIWEDSFSNLQIKRIYPITQEDNECTRQTYPDCTQLTLIENRQAYTSVDTFVALCRYNGAIKQSICELGKIIAGVSEP